MGSDCDEHLSQRKESITVQSSPGIFRTAPLFPMAVGLIVGVVLDRSLQYGLVVYVVLFAAIGTSIPMYLGMRHMHKAVCRPTPAIGPLMILLSSACVGGVLHLRSARTMPALSIERYLKPEGGSLRSDQELSAGWQRIARLRGKIASEPRLVQRQSGPFQRWMPKQDRTVFLLDVESIQGIDGVVPATGLVRVSVDEAVLALGEAERVEVFGWLYPFQPPGNPGAFDWRAFRQRQGVAAGMRCKHKENVRRLDDKPTPPQSDLLTRLRTTVRGMLISDLSDGTTEEEATLLAAMVLGHRSKLDRRLNDLFVRAGCVHFLAVSGLHLAVPMSFLWWLGRRLGCSGRRCAWLMLGSVLFYVTIAEPRPPILRASVMGALLCFSFILERPRSGLNWLAAAAIVLVLITPQTVFDAGFQLSFVAVLGIMCLTSSFKRWLAEVGRQLGRAAWTRPVAGGEVPLSVASYLGDRKQRRMYVAAVHTAKRYLLWPLAVGLGAWLATAPVVASHFHQAHAWAPISSVVVFPFVYVLILASFAKILLEAACPGWGSLLAGPIAALEDWLMHLVDFLGSLPGATWFVSPPPWWWVFSWYLLLIVFAWRFRPLAPKLDEQTEQFLASPPVRSPWLRAAWGATFACLALSSVAWCWPKAPSNRLVVTVLSVRAGSAMVVELPDGQAVLCDAGNTSSYDVGRHTVVPFLRHRGLRRVERIYVSHPNFDHYSGVPSIVEGIKAGPLVVNEYFHRGSRPNSASAHLLEVLNEQAHPVQVLDSAEPVWELGGVKFELLWPPPDLSPAVPTNETSTVLRLTYAGHSILLTGDIEDHAQRKLLEQGDLSADVLVLPHHGGMEPSSKAFFDAVGASIWVRSSHQPRVETLNGLYEIAGATPIYNTADVGAVEIVIDKDGIRVSSMWEPGMLSTK